MHASYTFPCMNKLLCLFGSILLPKCYPVIELKSVLNYKKKEDEENKQSNRGRRLSKNNYLQQLSKLKRKKSLICNVYAQTIDRINIPLLYN